MTFMREGHHIFGEKKKLERRVQIKFQLNL